MAEALPASTYRLQLSAEFTFADAAAIADYLAALGISHVYLSPVLQAAAGSTHGYDVIDHSRISADLGGEDGFRAMAAEFRENGLGIVVDVVPNHMGIAAPESDNRQFWSVLQDGPASAFASWFDIDWAARGGRLLLPVLGGPVADCLDDLTVDRLPGGEPVLRYFGHVLPVRAGTEDLALPELIDAQHYELADWHLAATELNWRRFFDITTLIGVRVEDPGVFAATHAVLLRLAAEGLIDGLRIDHPDGLADPRGYLRRLAAAAPGAWIVTEKILTSGERLPADWAPACAGTTGYDALRYVGGVFADPAGAGPLTAEYVRFTTGPGEFPPVAVQAKHQIAGGSLAAELARLGRAGGRCAVPEFDAVSPAELGQVLTELVAAVSVYRAYVVPGEEPAPAAVAVLTEAGHPARSRLPEHLHPVLDALTGVLLDPLSGRSGTADEADQGGEVEQELARAELAVRFQQTCGPVMAKGVEDTAFYRWSRLTALNEVGGEPGVLGVSAEQFHAFAARLAADWPATMTTLSTHDTKRGEDLRARLLVLTERPEEWSAAVTAWHDEALQLGGGPEAGLWPEADTEYLLWQTLAGGWPVSADRLSEYLGKVIHEAKTRSSWTDPDPEYDAAVEKLGRAVLESPDLAGRIERFAASLGSDARVNSLGAKLIQLTMPGVPDVYQGCELGGFALVDPDNRRPADFARRRELLAALAASGPEPGDLDQEKLLVTTKALTLRREHPDWFAGAYEPLPAEGEAAGHAVAFARAGRAVTVVTRLPAGLRRRGGWGDTALVLPGSGSDGGWRDLLSGTVHAGPRIGLAAMLPSLPICLLVPEGSTGD